MKILEANGLERQSACCLSHLLPYDPHIKTGERLKDGLKEYLLLLTATEGVIDSFKKDKLVQFDPLVGENACQIRALKLALILNECSFDFSKLLDKIDRSKQKVQQFLALKTGVIDPKVSLFDLIQSEEIGIPLNETELFLIKSYLLSKVKTERAPKPEFPLVKNEYTDTKKIKEIGKVGTMFAENLVKSLRERVSSSSVEFVQMLASRSPYFETSVAMVSDKYLIKHRGLNCLPCYWMTKVLMQEALIKKIPIVMVVEQIAKDKNYQVINKTTLFFEATPNGYAEASASSLDPEIPALILLGRSCRNSIEFPEEEAQWKKQLLLHNPVDLVLTYAAAHRQYPDESKDQLVSSSQDESYQFHKARAREWGCSIENPFLFFLAHAYCDKIKNIRIK